MTVCLCRVGMGGAYLTLLNTIANMGVILPKTPLFAAMDVLTVSNCRDDKGNILQGLTCPKKLRELTGSNACTLAGMTMKPRQFASANGLTPTPFVYSYVYSSPME